MTPILPYLPYMILTLAWVNPIFNVLLATPDDFRPTCQLKPYPGRYSI